MADGVEGVIWAQRMAAVLLGVAMSALAFLATAWNLGLPPLDPQLAGSLADDPARVFGRFRSELTPSPSGISDAYRKEVLDAARRDPLGDEALLVAALGSGSEGRYSEASRLLELARKRDPRNEITRIMLLEVYLRQARAREVVTETAVLERLSPGATQTLLPLIVGFAQNASTRAAATRAIEGSTLDYPVMRALAELQVDPALIMSLRASMTAEQLRDDSAMQQVNGLIDPYLRAGKWSEAAQLWGYFYKRQPGELGRVTDPKFSGSPGPPFGWQFTRTDGGLAEESDEGLQIVHFGRKGWVVARQALMLKPGTYRLSYKLGREAPNLPDLAWRIDCATSGTTLLDLPFKRENFLGISVTDRFTVPSDACEAQWVALAARVGDTTETGSVVIRSVDISWQGDN
jgi:hypothetical protein